ncbi:MAG: NUDIX hydrolase [Gammaproteobacteria bacterium]|nr:NUDIX hydrolase [Gammaproteobacteria bacterium]
MMQQSTALEALNQYRPDAATATFHDVIRQCVERSEQFWSRSHFEPGHLTASAWITNPEKTHVVLLLHGKLGIWVQPGGHIEPEDANLLQAALREATEETGLSELSLGQAAIFDVDIHDIPARKDEPAHQHLDVRYWFTTTMSTLTISDESSALGWVPLADVDKMQADESVMRMVAKTLDSKASA